MRQQASKRFKRWLRQSEAGQSIVLLALGFIALVAFVGITTDVSILFVRYSQLARAVDSAAISAANQIREGTTHATVQLAATSFIELHGVKDLQEVEVVTCEMFSQPDLQTKYPDFFRQCSDEDPGSGSRVLRQDKLVMVSAQTIAPTVFMRLLGFQDFPLPYTAVSQTAALDVVVIFDVKESMARYTTVEDWAEIGQGIIYLPPRAAGIFNRKFPSTPPADLIDNYRAWWESDLLLVPQQIVHERLCYEAEVSNGETCSSDGNDPFYEVEENRTHFVAQYGAQTDPREGCRVRFWPPSSDRLTDSWYGEYDEVNDQYISLHLADSRNSQGAPTLYGQLFQANTDWGGTQLDGNIRTWDGFVPVYNWYGCCNDPNGDGSFDDLICEPFKQVRDATESFLDRIDFTRGDRVGYVTFDRSAFFVNPYGYYSETAYNNRNNLERPGGMISNPEVALSALRDLIGVRAEPNHYVYDPGYLGASEPATDENLYKASWVDYAAGLDEDGFSIPLHNYVGDPADTDVDKFNRNDGSWDALDLTNPRIFNYPTKDNCFIRNAASEDVTTTLFDFALQRIMTPGTDFDGFQTQPDPLWEDYVVPAATTGEPFQRSDWPLLTVKSDPASYSYQTSYEFRAACREGNIGAALREGNNALLNPRTVRRFGTVWVMVLLSDGAAGASDPVRRNGDRLPEPQPYQATAQLDPQGNPIYGVSDGRDATYGAFGLCPYGTPTEPGELVEITGELPGEPPFCADEDPRTRHRCDFRPKRTLPPFNQDDAMHDANYVEYDPAGYGPGNDGPASKEEELEWNRARGNLYDVELADCDLLYDVDDYARDWADFVALQTPGSTAQLPSIFTIGFGLEYPNRNYIDNLYNETPIIDIGSDDPADIEEICRLNPYECIGEQLLRYIADVGDNNQLDNDYYQDIMSAGVNQIRLPRGILESGDLYGPSFGPRGRCQQDVDKFPNGSYNQDGSGTLTQAEEDLLWLPVPFQTSCGNYYFAPDGGELQLVFDDIASRMFTRLAR